MNFIEFILILSWSGVVVVKSSGQVRLVGGKRNGEGRLEVRGPSGRWSSVCPDGWTASNAGVACEELYGERKYASSLPAQGLYGNITNPIRIFDTKCIGYESSVVNCGQLESNVRTCYEDTAVGLCCHSGCDGRNMFLAPRLSYAASCQYDSYTVTVQKPNPNIGPPFTLWPNNKPDCRFIKAENQTHNWITVKYVGECDLDIDINDKDYVKYKQQVLIKGQSISSSISRIYQYLLPVTCGVNRNTNKTIWLENSPPEGNTIDLPGVNGSVNLDMIIKVYKDPDFTIELATPVQLKVGTPIYVEIFVDRTKLNAGSVTPKAKILLEDCLGTPFLTGSNIKHVIVKEQKADDPATDIFRSPALNKVQFKTEIFKFPNSNSTYLNCAGYVCPLSDNKWRCNNPAANWQHKPGASTAVRPTDSSPAAGSMNIVSESYDVLAPKFKKSPIYDMEDLPGVGLGPDDEVRIEEGTGKCFIKQANGVIRLYHHKPINPIQSSFATKAENPCVNQL